MQRRSRKIPRDFVFFLIAPAITAGALCLAQAQPPSISDATRLLQERNYQGALDLLTQLQKAQSGDPRVWTLKGIALENSGRKEECLAAFQRALRLNPDYLPALEGAAQIEYQERKPAARTHLAKIVQIDPTNQTAHAMLGALAFGRKDCKSAVNHFRDASSVILTQPAALQEFGACLLEERQPSAAATVYEELARLEPEDKSHEYALGVALYEAQRYEEAIQALEPLAAESHPNLNALDLLGEAYEKNHQTQLAVAALRRAILLSPRDVRGYLDIALISLDHGSFQVGIDFLNAGLREIPNSAALHTARGILYVQLGQYDKAETDFDQAARLNPHQNYSHVALGISLLQNNQINQSLASVKDRLAKTPNDPVLNYLLAEILLRQGVRPGTPGFAQAMAAARKAVALDPTLVFARDDLAQLELNAGRIKPAIEQSQQALKADPTDQTAVYHLVVAYRRSGQTQEAVALTKKLAQMAVQNEREQQTESRYRLVEKQPAAR
ncbi:MAG TPA: tetratricopeptide repeat protein [Terriglobia bacterium]|nr:tetratricopeptide repeat protein [Terriglobia bacterium]